MFTPLNLPDLITWFDASVSSKITLNGGDVSNWEASNDASIDAAQSTASKQPLYSLAARNGRNVVDYTTSNNDALNTGSVTHNLNAGNWYLAAALSPDTVAGTKTIVSVGGDDLQIMVVGANPEVWRGSGLKYSSLTLSAGVWYILEFWRSGSSFRARLDKVLDTDSHTSTNDPGSADILHIGQGASGSNEGWEGPIGEIVFTSSLPSSADRDDTYEYLKSKWGL